MSAQRRSSLSPAARSKPATVEEAMAASKKEAADKARADAEEAARAIAAVKELMAREAAATTPLIILDD
jgi:hypothetical protein